MGCESGKLGVGRDNPLPGERGCKYNVFHREGFLGGGLYFFEDGVHIRVFLERCSRLRAVCCEVGEDLVIGQDGRLGFKDFHWKWGKDGVDWVTVRRDQDLAGV